MLEKHYSPADIEGRIYAQWDEAGAFRAGRKTADGTPAEPFCIVIPPPNVTGSLHMGHALNNTLQDVLIRFERMRGKDVLWQPGTDHAGIATQSVVERQLMEKQQPDRRAMGREAFIKRVWEWKEESGGTITSQLRRLGASCDWSRERFTMGANGAADDPMVRAVTKAFVDLYRQGLIYKDKRLVNWDTKLLTAISDLEVQSVETKGHLWYFRYPIKNPGKLKQKFITVATTRPETMLGDTAVAVHPDDKRWKKYIGKMVELPLTGREIPIVADEYADPEQGSGAVKITPAHDENDFEVGRRHDLPLINIFDQHGAMNENVPEAYRGMDRFDARTRIVADLEALDLVEKIEPHGLKVPYGDRSNTIIEPWLTDQWYVDAETLAGPAIAAVEDGRTVFVPKNWEKTYFEWMRNIKPWCISRQLWWGHQIPAWYGPDGEIFVAFDEAEAKTLAEAHYGKPAELRRDEDVLDTWFSSGLWAFSTLGWPDETPELAHYYPTSALVTGFDIIFFWVARMMMMGLHFMGKVPFHTVYIHALVRDEKGQKMSKSKGNVMNPLDLIDQYGADALRFTLAAMAAQGRDIKLATSRVEGYRNFATKIWNAARFGEMNGCALVADFDPAGNEQTLNRWIAGEAQRASLAVTEAIEQHRYNDAANAAYQFVWHTFCDWYLELAKPILTGANEAAKAETQAMFAWTFDRILALLHPFMPFITEELWQRTGEAIGGRDTMLILAPWPQLSGLEDNAADDEIAWLIEFVSEVRSVRSEMNVPPAAQVPLVISGADKAARARAERHGDTLSRLARLSAIRFEASPPKGAVQIVMKDAILALPLADIIDLAAETDRLRREIVRVKGDISKLEQKLSDEKFTARAPDHVVEENRERLATAAAAEKRLNDALKRLEAAA